MRVLLIEDQADLQRIVRDMLEEEGYAVDTCSDGMAGFARAMSCDYDAIVLDLMLPKMDGRELLERLRERRNTPVLILSALDELADRCHGLDLGADDYLPKPFRHEELLARLRALIRRAAGQANPQIEIGNVSIDTRAKTVSLNGKVVSLTTREYSLLEYLAMHRGRVITRNELFDHLFDEIDEINSNMLDVYISYLRKKLGNGLITTRRGLGYLIPK
ncbi:DNA-binding response regulator [Bremerella cremea]|uniref:DNA-binding response regulator n=1 Tax=Bremerella cremea TaxID=1031537 RepID=A0A368KXA7_9BACT|nr:response regulator transcription factor [Bremerella cremea]RCS54285.1 DNA-binding response regulator [Bremerella cremea]